MADTTTTHHPPTTSNAGTLPEAGVQVVSVPGHRNVTVIRLHGDIDLQSVPALDAGLSAALSRRTHLLVDLSNVHLIDCPSLGLLVRARHMAQQRDTVLALLEPSPLVRLSLRATRLAAVFPTFSDLRQALALLGTPAGTPRLRGPRRNNLRHCRRRPAPSSSDGTRP